MVIAEAPTAILERVVIEDDTIRLSEIDEQCTPCSGSGIVASQRWKDWHANYIRAVLPTERSWLMSACKPGEEPFNECRDCNGRGRVLTPNGERFLRLAATYLPQFLPQQAK